MFLLHHQCTRCSAIADASSLIRTCPVCGGVLAARYDLPAIARSVDKEEISRRPARLWSWREVLPLPADAKPVDLGEGGTPLLELPRLGNDLGIDKLLLKDESQNPTGSFKARGMAVAVTMAKHLGATALAVPTAGNAGGALAAYGARAGLPVHIAMPADTPAPNRLEAALCGAQVTGVEGTIADAGKWIRERSEEHGWFDLSTLKEPYRVEGKKTMGYELARDLGWRLPDVILYPTGGGTGLVGMWKAFAEMRALGWLNPEERLPRMVVVQASGCAPMVEAFESGAEASEAPAAPATCASGLRVPTPAGDRWMLQVLRESQGTAVAVSDKELLEATARISSREGIFVAPEGGALVKALEKLKESGWVKPEEEVVLFNTGTGLKYPECFEGRT